MREVIIPREAGRMERVELSAVDRAEVVRKVRGLAAETKLIDWLDGRVRRLERALWGLGIFVMVLAIALVLVVDVVLSGVISGR